MTYFCVTIDTECDMPNWKPKKLPTLENIKELPKLQELLNKYEIKPTYLITYPVATEAISVDILKTLHKVNNCEIGTHFHPWTTPPIKNEEIEEATFPHKLDINLHKLKLTNLTNAIKKSFNINPVSYRAGRFGFDSIGLKIIEDLNYKIDTSITPLTNWGANFTNAPIEPYFLHHNNLSNPGKSKVLEVPVTIDIDIPIKIKKLYGKSPEKIKGFISLLGIKRVWLRPSISSSRDMIKLSNKLIENNHTVLNMMFHSNELSIKTSPFNNTKLKLENYYNRLGEYFKFINKNKIESKTLHEFYKIYVNNI